MLPVSVSASASRSPIDDDWEVVNVDVWSIHKQPAEELRIALGEANPERARTAIDRLRDQIDRRKIDGAECLQHLLAALGDVDLSNANPAAALYLAALVSLKTTMTQKRFYGRGPWPEEHVAMRLGKTMPPPSPVTSPMNRKLPATAAATRWIGRVKAFMEAELVSPERSAALLRAWDGARQAQRVQIAKQATTLL